MTPSKSKTRKRFYKTAAAAERENGKFAIELDARPIKTPAGHELAVPTRALAEAIAAEWTAQSDDIDPASLPLTRLANSAIDGVAAREGEVVQDILNYAASDLVCYRAEGPAILVKRQAQAWDPILASIAANYDAPFKTGTGVQPIPQPQASLDALRRVLVKMGPFHLAALHVMTTLTGSALIALAHALHFFDAEAAWQAAHIDETWQASQWGEDGEAAQRQKRRHSDFFNASRFYELA